MFSQGFCKPVAKWFLDSRCWFGEQNVINISWAEVTQVSQFLRYGR
jgi:hypothetical protein